METRNIPSPKGLCISRGLPDLCFDFPVQGTPSTSPLALLPSLIKKKKILTWGGITITLLQSEGWLSRSAITTTSDLDVRGEEERKKGENWGQNSPPNHSAPGRPYKVI